MKKQILLILVLALWSSASFAQDIIVKTNGDQIKSKVLEITDNTIKYKAYDFLNGPTRDIDKSEVFMIIYSNGKREIFTTKENSVNNSANYSENNSVNNATNNPVNNSVTNNRKTYDINQRGNYFSIAVGDGWSYGGYGVRFQYVTPNRIGIHAGVGYGVTSIGNGVLYSAGIQFYFYKDWYVDAQFGAFGFISTSYQEWSSGYYYSSDTWKTLYGPSLLTGYDLYLSDKFGINLASGASLDVNGNSDIWFAFDAGLVFRF